MENVTAYRQKILEAMLKARTQEGNPRVSEATAHKLAKEFTDQELLDGMDYNTPDEVAEMLLDSGLED